MITGEIKILKASRSMPSGAFLELPDGKEIFLPKSERMGRIIVGEKYLVIIFQDERTSEYLASERINNFLIEKVEEGVFEEGQLVEGIVYEFSPLGAKVCINKKYLGLIYANEIFQTLNTSDKVKVFIKKIRIDGKIDLSLQKGGYKNFIDETSKIILDALEKSGGILYLNDKSSPEEIYEKLQISKKRFKESIGGLFRQKKIDITDKSIILK